MFNKLRVNENQVKCFRKMEPAERQAAWPIET